MVVGNVAYPTISCTSEHLIFLVIMKLKDACLKAYLGTVPGRLALASGALIWPIMYRVPMGPLREGSSRLGTGFWVGRAHTKSLRLLTITLGGQVADNILRNATCCQRVVCFRFSAQSSS